MKIKNLLLALVLMGGTLTSEAQISIALIDGDWTNPAPGGLVTINNSGPAGGLSTARWGGGAQPSGYDFASTTTPFNALTNGTPFSLGTFTHQNFPIPAGTSPTSIDLALTLGNIINVNTTFSFTHNETSNTQSPATNPANNDLVTIANPIVNFPFTYAGDNYFFNLVGFSTDGGATTTTSFSTVETQANTATLYARITTTAQSTPDAGSSLLLLGLSLLGVGVLKKCKK
jgi:hypothetical protein